MVQVKVLPGRLRVDWLDPEWAEWKELHESEELKALVEMTSKKIRQAKMIPKASARGNQASNDQLRLGTIEL